MRRGWISLSFSHSLFVSALREKGLCSGFDGILMERRPECPKAYWSFAFSVCVVWCFVCCFPYYLLPYWKVTERASAVGEFVINLAKKKEGRVKTRIEMVGGPLTKLMFTQTTLFPHNLFTPSAAVGENYHPLSLSLFLSESCCFTYFLLCNWLALREYFVCMLLCFCLLLLVFLSFSLSFSLSFLFLILFRDMIDFVVLLHCCGIFVDSVSSLLYVCLALSLSLSLYCTVWMCMLRLKAKWYKDVRWFTQLSIAANWSREWCLLCLYVIKL